MRSSKISAQASAVPIIEKFAEAHGITIVKAGPAPAEAVNVTGTEKEQGSREVETKNVRFSIAGAVWFMVCEVNEILGTLCAAAIQEAGYDLSTRKVSEAVEVWS
mgnify:CR=1 FL=1